MIRTTALLIAALSLAACRSAAETGGDDLVFQRAAGALGPYSGAVLTEDLAFVSGKIGDRSGDFVHEAETAIDAVEAELGRVGLGLERVVSATIYLTDMERYAEFNEVWSRRLPPPYPARACVAVAALPAGAAVEIRVVAAR